MKSCFLVLIGGAFAIALLLAAQGQVFVSFLLTGALITALIVIALTGHDWVCFFFGGILVALFIVFVFAGPDEKCQCVHEESVSMFDDMKLEKTFDSFTVSIREGGKMVKVFEGTHDGWERKTSNPIVKEQPI